MKPGATQFAAGLASMAYADFHILRIAGGMAPEALDQVRVAVAPPRKNASTQGGGRHFLGISSVARQGDAALLVLDFLFQTDVMRRIAEAASLAPSRVSLQQELVRTDARYRPYFDSLTVAQDWFLWPAAGVLSAARRATPGIALSDEPVEAILRRAGDEAQSSLARTRSGAG